LGHIGVLSPKEISSKKSDGEWEAKKLREKQHEYDNNGLMQNSLFVLIKVFPTQ
jgi:hypothetical protein